MGVVSIKDQTGAAIGGIDIALVRRDEPTNELWRQYPDLAGHTDFYYSALGVVTHNDLPRDTKFNLILNRVEGLNPKWTDYEKGRSYEVDVLNPTAGAELTLQKTGGGGGGGIHCPIAHDKAQFTSWFWDMATRLNATICNNANMIKMVPELEKCGMVWQNQKVYTPDKWRPRIFQPPLNPPNYDSQWLVDCGDFGSEWVLTFRY